MNTGAISINKAKNRKYRAGVISVSIVLVISLFYAHLFVFPIKLQVGQIVPFTIASPGDGDWVDSEEFAKIKKEESQGFVLDQNASGEAVRNLNSFFAEVKRVAEMPPETRQSAQLGIGLKYPADELTIQKLLTTDFGRLDEIEKESAKLLSQFMSEPLDDERVATLKKNSENVYLSVHEQIAVSFLNPNLIYYQASNPEELFKDFFTFRIKKGDIIISEGQQVSQQVLDKMEAVKEAQKRQDFLTFIGLSLMYLIMMVLWAYYLRRFKQFIWNSPRSLAIVYGILIFSLAVCLIIIRIPYPYFYFAVNLPLIIGCILTCVVFDPIFALYLYGSLSLLSSWMFGFNTDLLIYSVVGVVTPPVFLTRMSDRYRIIRLGLILGVINVYLVGIVIMVGVQSYSVSPFVIAFVSGIAAAIFALGSQLFLDQLAVPLTRTRLDELSDTNSPILQQLMLKAPGTYNHSLVMAQMAEEAARAIGADALLARVGALYHDIGKVAQPKFFGENLADKNKNPHNKLEPKSSYNIILQHIEKGVELAKKNRLPQEIIQFIITHHGTSVMKYFYHQASGSESGVPVTPEEFSYPGPLPSDRETTIVNIADSCEAIVRARELATEDEIRAVVRDVIEEKIKTDQLANSTLSIKDLNIIGNTFASVLCGIYHSRIKYPDDMKKQIEKAASDHDEKDEIDGLSESETPAAKNGDIVES